MSDKTADRIRSGLSKVPQVTLVFWVVKILATTLGETGGDALSMTLKLGYLVSTLIFLGFFAVTLAGQVFSKRYHPVAYWTVVVATTTVGTTTSDYLDRTLGLGYVKSSIMLFCAVLVVLFAWKFAAGRIEYQDITSRRDEIFYWLAILVSNTLGTALGDFMASSTGIGFERGALVFAGLIALVAAAHFYTSIPDNVLFWAAYVLTRPLGATLGDTLTKSHAEGGLGLGRIYSSLVIAVMMVIMISLTSLRKRAPQFPAHGVREAGAEAD
ncbi:MAG: COG4705 family protein [Terriglobales bacterium]